MRVAKFLDVGDQLVAQFAVGEPTVALVRYAAPSPEMHLVDRDWVLEPGSILTPRDPFGVVPNVIVEVRDNGARAGSQFGAKREWISLQRKHVSAWADNFELVYSALVQLRHEEFPHARRSPGAHRVHATVPMVEVANHADAACARSPDGKINAAHSRNGF